MAVPVWQAAVAGSPGQASQVNQFLGTHSSSWTYSGATLQATQGTGSGTYQSTQGQYLAQSFTTGASQTTIGQVQLQVSTVGGSPVTATIPPLQLSLYATAGVLPTGTAIASVTVNEQYVYSSPFWVVFPLAVTGLAPSTIYQLVTAPVGTGTNYYVWQQSNQVSGAATSPDAVTWTGQGYGLTYRVYDQTGGGQLLSVYDDGGARWATFTYDALGRVSTVTEYAASQGATPFTSTRTLAYTGTALTGVS